MDFAALTLEFFLGSTVVPARDGRSMAVGRLDPDTIAVGGRVGDLGASASPRERRLIE